MAHEKNLPKSRERQLKIYEKFLRRGDFKVVAFPEIRLCGKWLHELGFEAGQQVTVKHVKNKLVITVGK